MICPIASARKSRAQVSAGSSGWSVRRDGSSLPMFQAAWNSAANTANAPTAPGNRPTDRVNEGRVIFTSDGSVVGYYAPNAVGVLNLFDTQGRRIAYRPARGTKSLFTVQGTWCGTVDGLRDGGLVLAVTADCARQFMR